jgi:hypothetical protein
MNKPCIEEQKEYVVGIVTQCFRKERPNKRRKKWHSKSEVANVAPAGRFCQKFSEKFQQFYKPLIFIRSQA